MSRDVLVIFRGEQWHFNISIFIQSARYSTTVNHLSDRLLAQSPSHQNGYTDSLSPSEKSPSPPPERLPRTTHVVQTHTLGQPCTGSVLSDLRTSLLEHIAELLCTAGRCDFKALYSACIGADEVRGGKIRRGKVVGSSIGKKIVGDVN